jgi:hypothetical protein
MDWCMRIVAALAGALSCSAGVSAQCSPEWLPGDGLPGVNSAVNAATVWDPRRDRGRSRRCW